MEKTELKTDHQVSAKKSRVGGAKAGICGDRAGASGKVLQGKASGGNVKTDEKHDGGVVLVPPSKSIKLRKMVLPKREATATAASGANKYLESKETDMVLIAGVDCVTDPPITTYIFNSMGVITKDKIRPFDKKRSGMAMGEAAFCYVLTREEDAQKRLAKFSDVCKPVQ
jgi:hypothetical protein